MVGSAGAVNVGEGSVKAVWSYLPCGLTSRVGTSPPESVAAANEACAEVVVVATALPVASAAMAVRRIVDPAAATALAAGLASVLVP